MDFDKSFFEKEIRCGFEVPVMMKRAWAAAMEVLQVVGDICERNKIQYFADGGTMLGAVRHKGFIPWDDDIDICLRREDYNRLISILPGELPYGFVVAGMYADSVRLQNAADVQHLRVIADETLWNYNDYMMRFHGFPYLRIGIDIFPWDYLPRDEKVVDAQREIMRYIMITLQNWQDFERAGQIDGRIKEIERVCSVKFTRDETLANQMWRVVDSVCSLGKADEADEIGNYVYMIEEEGYRVRKECYSEAVYMDFEQIKVPVPVGYDEILKAKYGDYMEHVRAYVDHNYPFYGHMEKALVEQIRNIGFDGTVDEFCEQVGSGKLRVNA